jgi:hypothetical protein
LPPGNPIGLLRRGKNTRKEKREKEREGKRRGNISIYIVHVIFSEDLPGDKIHL